MSHAEDLTSLLTPEQGKLVIEARENIGYGNSEEARWVRGEVAVSQKNTKEMLFISQPIVVLAMITLW